MAPFNPDDAARPGAGVFGLPHSREEAGIILIPVPFDATTSYGGGASAGPNAIRAASAQVDLYDHHFGRVYERGIFMEPVDRGIAALSARARALAAPIIAKGGAEPGDEGALREVDSACERMNEFVHERAARALAEGKVPGVVGGDHSTPFGAIRACAEQAGDAVGDGIGVLQVDAHMDLRVAFEGFAWSHASIMWNVLERIPGVKRLVQVGIRDFGEGEMAYAREAGGRVTSHFDADLFARLDDGDRWADMCRGMLDGMPRRVFVSFDIDGLDPALCPHTGTPVPGGLSFNGAAMLLKMLMESGRTVVGFDLNEVCPAPGGLNEWDANVGARILYKLCGCAANSSSGRFFL
ncbi:MAG TPA: arginase [Phycisphaerales bacterium]|nr:arginase [Phycisphaerales bacterium]